MSVWEYRKSHVVGGKEYSEKGIPRVRGFLPACPLIDGLVSVVVLVVLSIFGNGGSGVVSGGGGRVGSSGDGGDGVRYYWEW